MAKSRGKKKSESVTFGYPRTYSIVLWNTGADDHGRTFGTLLDLINEEINRIDAGTHHDGRLKALMIIRDQMNEEFQKGGHDG